VPLLRQALRAVAKRDHPKRAGVSSAPGPYTGAISRVGPTRRPVPSRGRVGNPNATGGVLQRSPRPSPPTPSGCQYTAIPRESNGRSSAERLEGRHGMFGVESLGCPSK
jgi:hypothetical protein